MKYVIKEKGGAVIAEGACLDESSEEAAAVVQEQLDVSKLETPDSCYRVTIGNMHWDVTFSVGAYPYLEVLSDSKFYPDEAFDTDACGCDTCLSDAEYMTFGSDGEAYYICKTCVEKYGLQNKLEKECV